MSDTIENNTLDWFRFEDFIKLDEFGEGSQFLVAEILDKDEVCIGTCMKLALENTERKNDCTIYTFSAPHPTEVVIDTSMVQSMTWQIATDREGDSFDIACKLELNSVTIMLTIPEFYY